MVVLDLYILGNIILKQIPKMRPIKAGMTNIHFRLKNILKYPCKG